MTLLTNQSLLVQVIQGKRTVCVCSEIVDAIQGDEQVNDGQMIKGGVIPEQLRMEGLREKLCCLFK